MEGDPNDNMMMLGNDAGEQEGDAEGEDDNELYGDDGEQHDDMEGMDGEGMDEHP